MTIYYLYIKTHNKTGLRYLGQTKQKDPFNYTGSGIDWKSHLITYGRDFTTTIVESSSDKNTISQLGRHLSNLWKITTSMDDFGNKIWANRIPETGSGPGWKKGEGSHTKTQEFRKWRSESQKGFKNPKFDDTIYTFQHKISREVCKMTRHDFIKMTGAFHSNVSDLINPKGKQKSVKQWMIIRTSIQP